MDLQDLFKNAFYFSVGAAAAGMEAASRASKDLTKKGAVIVKKSKKNFLDFCEKTDFSSFWKTDSASSDSKD